MPEYEYQRIYLPRDTDRETTRVLLTAHAEYGRWELDRMRMRPDGTRWIRLRRAIIRQQLQPA